MRRMLIHKSTKPLFHPACVGVLILCLLALCGCDDGTTPETLDVKINGHKFNMQLALDSETRHKGLSGRADIPEDKGMLFAFSDASIQRFVMRECLVPIDIVYVDESGRVTSSHAMTVEDANGQMLETQLKTYSSDYPAIVALEFKGGTLAKLNLKRGDTVDLPIADLKTWAE